MITYSITFINSIIGGATMDLTPDQIERLEALGNRSSNWAGVKLTGTAAMSYDLTIERIRNCTFSGTVYLGLFLKNVTLEHGIQVPCGLYNSNFSGTCVLSDNCYVWNTAMVANVFLGRNTSLIGCGSVLCSGQTSYGTQHTICVGAESDSASSSNARSTLLNVNLTYGEVCSKLMAPKRALSSPTSNALDGNAELAMFMNIATDFMGSNAMPGSSSSAQTSLHANSNSNLNAVSNGKKQQQQQQQQRTNRSDDLVRFDLTIICDDVEISNCPLISNSFIGGYCKVKSSSLKTSALLANCVIENSEVEDCVMHGSCSITSMSIVSGVLMYPHAHISEGAKVSETIMGPDSSVGVGEVKRSILGPFVGFHHTGLLIASLWPLGRGNMGYGAMVGANHTSRTNDQECVPGEGVFFGLGAAVRFPFSMLLSPYSIVAANSVCLPQKIAFPFSLVARNETVALHGVVDTSLCSLRPGWCLWANTYFLERSLSKFSKRRKSTEYRTDFPVFRPAIVDMILDARHRLMQLRSLVNPPPQQTPDDATTNTSANAPTDSSNGGGSTSQSAPPASQGNNTKSLVGIYLHGAQVEALGGGRCLIAAKDLDIAYDAYSQFVIRYALHVRRCCTVCACELKCIDCVFLCSVCVR